MGATADDVSNRQQAGYHRINQAGQQQELAALMAELKATPYIQATQPNPVKTISADDLARAKAITARYYTALDALTSMLNGKRMFSLIEAHYAIEQAFGNPYLSKTEFEHHIARSADFIRCA